MIISKKIIFKLQADSNMNDLIAEYQQYEDAGIDDEGHKPSKKFCC